MLRFRRMQSLQKFATVHSSVYNHFNQARHQWDQVLEWERRRERAELMREHGRQSRGVEQEADRVYQEAMQGPLQVGAEDKEAFGMEGKRQAEGLSISLNPHGRDLGIERVDELNIERRRDLPDIG